MNPRTHRIIVFLAASLPLAALLAWMSFFQGQRA